MQAPASLIVIVVGLLLLWLAITGRLEAVWLALTMAGAERPGLGDSPATNPNVSAVAPLPPLPDVPLPDLSGWFAWANDTTHGPVGPQAPLRA